MDYGLRCLVYLSGLPNEKWAATSDLGKKLRVSNSFLAKIFQALAKANVIESQRGKLGGVRLKRRKITLAKLIKILKPNAHLNECLARGYSCFLRKKCPIHKIMTKLEKELMAKLDKITLNKLRNRK